MATKNKKIETRITPESYMRLKAIADKHEMSIYEIVQDFIYNGIEECCVSGGGRTVLAFVNNEMYDKLVEIAEEYDATIQGVVWNCIRVYLERLEKKKDGKVTDNKNRQG